MNQSVVNPEKKILPRVILHVDMDAFFASVEVRNCPDLRGKPVIVGGPVEGRGVVAACSYETRPFGIHSGMPLSQARRLCPQVIMLRGNHQLYGYVSSQVMKILSDFTPLVEPVSVDEAYLDITGSLRLMGSAEKIARQIKENIREKLKLTCSVGVGPNKVIAKMAGKLEKPDGLTSLTQSEYRQRFGPSPVGVLWGIGASSEKALNDIGIHTVAELGAFPLRKLTDRFGQVAIAFKALALGENSSPVCPLEALPEDKSISHETTFAKDSLDREYLHRVLLALSVKVARRLRKGDYLSRTISVKIRSASFKTITRDKTLGSPLSDHRKIYAVTRELLPGEYGESVPVRLLGVRASNLSSNSSVAQLTLFDDFYRGNQGNLALDDAFDRVLDKYGEGALRPASMVDSSDSR